MHDALAELSVEAILTTTVIEGCVAETVAAVEAAEALEHARDPGGPPSTLEDRRGRASSR